MRRRITSAAAGVALVVTALQMTTAGGASAKPGDNPSALRGAHARASVDHLSARLSALATSSSLRSQSTAERAKSLSVAATGAGSLMRRGSDYVVQVRFDGRTGAAQAAAVRAAGGRVLHVSRDYRTITAAVPATSLRSVGSVARVASVTEVLTPQINGADGLSAGKSGGAHTNTQSSNPCTQGKFISEGDTQLRADLARAQTGATGAGVTVGVLSDSYNQDTAALYTAPQDVANGDLPGSGNPCGFTTPVNVLSDTDTTGEDEGRGMLQVVHDLAPAANLAFATAFTSETSFADNILALQSQAGASDIVDDVTYYDEPAFQEGPIANAASTVVANGATYFSSAANDNLIVNGQNVSAWESPAYRPTACPSGIPSARDCENFNPAGTDNTYGVQVANNGETTMSLQWAEPFYGVKTNLDFYVTNSAGQVVASSDDNNASTGEPFEFLQWTNTTGSTQNYNIYVVRTTTGDQATPRIRLTFLQNGLTTSVPTEYVSSTGGDIVGPAIFGHNGGANVMSTAAVPYNNSAKPEDFSSRGPVTHYFAPVNGKTPAAALAAPQVLAKPDVAATDGGETSFFGQLVSGAYRFYGTSEAAPHAAAVAALERSAHPGRTPQAYDQAQRQTARAVGAYTANDVGAGLIDALGATQLLATTANLSVSTTGAGTVTSADGHISCGTACNYLYPTGTSVTLTAAPTNGGTATFTGCDSISGNTCTVALGSDKAVGVSFGADKTPPTVKVYADPFTVQLKKKIHLYWRGKDSQSGVASYKVQVAKAGYQSKLGKYKTSSKLSGTATQGTFTGGYGHTYCFRVSAVDGAGNASKYTGGKCVELPVDDRALKAGSGWKRTKGDTYSGTLTVAKKHGATLTLKNVKARRLGVVLRACPSCGKVGIWFDGKKVALQHGKGPKGKKSHNKIVFAKPFSKLKTGTVTIKVLSHGKKVQVDGLVASFAKNPGKRLNRAFGDQG